MSKYDTYLAIKQRNQTLIKDFENQIPIDRDRDKTDLQRWAFEGLTSAGNWGKLRLTVGMSHGYYGNSSASDDCSEEAGIELAITLSGLRDQIVKDTVSRLESQIKEAARQAEQEAKDVLTRLS